MSVLNDELSMVRPTLIDMNPVELNFYPFTINLNKCTGICNALPPKIYVPKETKDVNFKAFDKITNKDEAKEMSEHISCDCKCKFNSATCNSKQNGIIKRVNVNVKNYHKCKKYYTWNPLMKL